MNKIIQTGQLANPQTDMRVHRVKGSYTSNNYDYGIKCGARQNEYGTDRQTVECFPSRKLLEPPRSGSFYGRLEINKKIKD